MKRDFKGIWVPAEIWLNKDLKLIEKMFMVEIDSLDNEKGCYASNGYFAEFFGISKGRCSQIIKSLKEKNILEIEYHYEGKQITKRVLRILKGGIYFSKGGYLENDKGNNTEKNNTLLINKEKTLKKENSIFENKEITQLKTEKKEKEKIPQKRKKFTLADIDWPPVFDQNKKLKDTFLSFAQMRQELKKPYKTKKGTETKLRALAKDCEKYGIENVIGAIEFSEGSEYLGIFVHDYTTKKQRNEKQRINNEQKTDFYEAYRSAIYDDQPEETNHTIDINWDEPHDTGRLGESPF
jgi:hypothetical protein